MRVFVCAGMKYAKNENINIQAKQLGEILGEYQDVTLVQGGSTEGLMGEILKSFYAVNKKVEFFIPEKYYKNDSVSLIDFVGEKNFVAKITKDEAERLNEIKKCDHIIVFPGGTGTLEEFLFCNETARAIEHSNKITIVNIDGFYNGFLSQINKNLEEGLTPSSALKYEVIDNVKDLKLNLNQNINLKI